MSKERAREYLEKYNVEEKIRYFDVSSATVELAAQALGVEGARIAKTMSFDLADGAILICAAGDTKIDNSKYKAEFHQKAKLIAFDEVESKIGHPVGGVCPFGINENVKVYIDKSILRFETIFPAAGTANSAVELTPEELFEISKADKWVDVTKL